MATTITPHRTACSRLRIFLAAWLTGFAFASLSAQNLAPNTSLENFTYCPTSFGQFNGNVTQWWSPASHGGSADYFNVCSTSFYGDAPTNYWGTQNPRTGNAYVGFATYYGTTPNFREYLEMQATTTLTAGTTYTLSFYISLCDQCGYGSNNVGAYFSAAPAVGSGGSWAPMTTYVPQINMSTALTDKTAWTLFTGNYVGTGVQSYITIGNFYSDAATTIAGAGSGTIPALAYYFIDDITLTPSVILNAELTRFGARGTAESVELTWDTRTEGNLGFFEIERSEGNLHSFHTVAKIAATGNTIQPGQYNWSDFTATPGEVCYYRLRTVDENGNAGFSQVEQATRLAGESLVASVFPQPLEGGNPLTLLLACEDGALIEWEMHSLEGSLQYAGSQTAGSSIHDVQIETSDFKPGSYLLRVSTSNSTAWRRIVIF